jgi:MbtH protein
MVDDDRREFRLVRNGAKRYFMWPAGRELSTGWFQAGTRRSQADCLTSINPASTYNRPAPLRSSARG